MKKISKRISLVCLLLIFLLVTGCRDTSPIESKNDGVVYTLDARDLIKMDRGNGITIKENEAFIRMDYGYGYKIYRDKYDEIDKQEDVVYVYHYVSLDKFKENEVSKSIEYKNKEEIIKLNVKGTYDFQIININNFMYKYVEYADPIEGLTADELIVEDYIIDVLLKEISNQLDKMNTDDYDNLGLEKLLDNTIASLEEQSYQLGIEYSNINIKITG